MTLYITRLRPVATKQGFALIATISVMVLLVMIALAMLSLSTIELRQESQAAHKQTAQANARMALMKALGDLQKYAGADQRVTATASILSDSVATHKKNWTTVWDTTDWDVTDPIKTRDSAYMGALVSGDEYLLPTDLNSATAALEQAVPLTDPEWIPLVAEGSVNETDEYVYAPRVDVVDSSSRVNGGYAYWVSDEGVKARLDVAEPANSPGNTWITTGKLAAAPGTGAHKVTGLADYTAYLPEGGKVDQIDKMMSYRSFDLSDLNAEALKENFHHLTASHTGLLVDNRRGGIRRDLSTAFEIDPEEFGEIEEFNNSGETNQTEEYSSFAPSDVTSNPLYYHNGTDSELGYLYEVPVDSSNRYRGPTWDLLRNHYRIYKKERNDLNFRGLPTPSSGALAAHGVVPFSYTGDPNGFEGSSLGSVYVGPNYNGGAGYQCPFVSSHGASGGHDARNGNRMQPTVQKITPELLRAVFVFGLAREEDQFYMTATPFFTFHNPYNYPLEFYSLSVDMRAVGSYTAFSAQYEDKSGANKTAILKYQSSDWYGLKMLTSYRLTPPSSGLHRLEPGEIRIMSMLPNTEIAASDRNIIRMTEFQYNEANGLVSNARGVGQNYMEVKTDSQITVQMSLKQANATLGNMFVRLYHPEKATGGNYNIGDTSTFSNNNDWATNRYNDTEPLSLIKQIKVWPYTQNASEARVFNESQVTRPDQGYLSLFVLDMNLKTFQDNVAVLSDFNYRAMGVGPRDYDGSDVIAPNWNMSISPIGDYSELQLTDSIDAPGYWGSSHEAGSGESEIVLFDLPHSPSVSLASLQHADTSKLNFHAMRSIGHSRPQVGQQDLTKIYNKLSNSRGTAGAKDQIDTAWASNEALWDRYYYSGINWGDQPGQPYATHEQAIQAVIDGNAGEVFANTRMQLLKPVTSENLAELTGNEGYSKIGEFLGIKGAFNVNSTSIEAWKAVLASLSGHEISYLTGTSLNEENLGNDLTPLSRFSTPAGDENNDFMGFRALSDKELEDLAEAIVDQVKLRGPFMGLADFVNRRLLSDETGEAGAIQAAIDEANLNSSVGMGSTSDGGLKRSAEDINEGMARHITQGDVLNSLAPVMATRSDTFVIRAYGDSKDADGVIRATAHCEMVVQRVPEWLASTTEEATVQSSSYPSQNPTTHPILEKWEENPNLPEVNKKFGRKFEVKSFRWLSKDEI
ncbi:hypothetical protein JO972_10105 [Verrucomicrobiaceae bacterium 5K15]|uniref:Uncharacterized protein n=1 Tax=Oceaniferula flava TaxID=2800421 RepID=A0AAE2VCN4_9BACT|nr:hypothetical protein [Oceaniferula flavus]MBK1855311.1 hypothetical protein [Oceaniferula flavus]MBM1136617.1 hypothetical protein [Oceaniferula flavus]